MRAAPPKGQAMEQFDYVRVQSIEQAIIEATQPGAAFIAGGTNLVDLLKVGIARPTKLVDITAIPELAKIENLPDGGLRIGALVRNSDLASDVKFRRDFPSVAEALLSGASAQLRNAATVGGNILQRTRCSYFFDLASACNKRVPGAGCSALDGENSSHAVFGWSKSCIATHPSDFCVPLVSLDAELEIVGPGGHRLAKLEGFHRLPDDKPNNETMLDPGELIVAVRLPSSGRKFARHSRYLKLRERTSFAFAVVSSAASLVIGDGVILEARLAIGGVALRPWRARAAENSLMGVRPGEKAFREASWLALADAQASGKNADKIELAKRLVFRALTVAEAGAGDRLPALPGSVFAGGVAS